MEALAAGDLDAAHARADLDPVVVHTRDEVGAMAGSFNTMQREVSRAAIALDGAREGLRITNATLEPTSRSRPPPPASANARSRATTSSR